MKPKMTMEEKPAVVFVSEAKDNTAKTRSVRKLLVIGAIIGLLCLVVIAGLSIGAFYLGMNAERESVQEAWVNFKAGPSTHNTTIVKEQVIVNEKEAEFRRPGVMNMVVDYENNVLVVQYDRELKGDEDVFCYVYDFEAGMFGTPEEAESIVSGDQTYLNDTKAEVILKVESTGEHVPLEQLSPRARQMCGGAEILRIRKTDKEVSDREKRSEKGKCCCCCCCCCCSKRCVALAFE